jgi:hypothetical protein
MLRRVGRMSRRFFAGVIRRMSCMHAYGGRRDKPAFPPYLAAMSRKPGTAAAWQCREL